MKFCGMILSVRCNWSHPSRGAWIEIRDRVKENKLRQSHPSRGAWIEMRKHGLWESGRRVAPLTGCVD